MSARQLPLLCVALLAGPVQAAEDAPSIASQLPASDAPALTAAWPPGTAEATWRWRVEVVGGDTAPSVLAFTVRGDVEVRDVAEGREVRVRVREVDEVASLGPEGPLPASKARDLLLTLLPGFGMAWTVRPDHTLSDAVDPELLAEASARLDAAVERVSPGSTGGRPEAMAFLGSLSFRSAVLRFLGTQAGPWRPPAVLLLTGGARVEPGHAHTTWSLDDHGQPLHGTLTSRRAPCTPDARGEDCLAVQITLAREPDRMPTMTFGASRDPDVLPPAPWRAGVAQEAADQLTLEGAWWIDDAGRPWRGTEREEVLMHAETARGPATLRTTTTVEADLAWR